MHLGRTNQQFNQTCWYVKITARDHHTNFNNLAQKGKISPVLSRNTLNIKNLKISFCVVRSSHGSMNKQSKKDWTVKKEKNWLTCDTLVLYLGKIKKIIAVFFHSKYLLAIYVGVAGRAVREKQVHIFKRGNSKPVKTAFSPRPSLLGTFRQERNLRLSDRNSILMT